MSTHTNEEIIAAARAAVRQKGADYVYLKDAAGNCYYANEDGSPSCIVGFVLSALDPDLFQRVAEKDNDTTFIQIEGLDDFTPEQRYVLQRAQADQDFGDTWGEALREIEALA